MEKNNVLQIDIAGNRYHVDADQENLIPVDERLAQLRIGELDVAMDNEWERFGYYDLINKCLYHIPDHLTEEPENVVGFAIPSHRDLAEKMHTSLVVYAEVVPLKETTFMMEVEERNMSLVKTHVRFDSSNSKVTSQNEIPGMSKNIKEEKQQQQRKLKKKRGEHL